jgi:PIN domain nuclease of toxin-antitoxin system
MRILLDTHIFLWFISGDTQLSTDVRLTKLVSVVAEVPGSRSNGTLR